jgi:molybdopterin synthase catalytic subunit
MHPEAVERIRGRPAGTVVAGVLERHGIGVYRRGDASHGRVRSVVGTVASVSPPDSRRIALTRETLPLGEVVEWATVPSCGAVVTFLGVTRDHSAGRDRVTRLTYEAYEEVAIQRLDAVAAEAERRWPGVERVALVHRLGVVECTEASVLVVVASPHRDVAFEAARFCIDTLKETVPIWKQEHWTGGSDWAERAHPVRPVPGSASDPVPAR